MIVAPIGLLAVFILALIVFATDRGASVPFDSSKRVKWAADKRRKGGVVSPATVKRKAQRTAQREATAAAKAELRARHEASLATVAEPVTVPETVPDVAPPAPVIVPPAPVKVAPVIVTPAEPYGPPYDPPFTGCKDHPAKRSGYCGRCADLEDAE